jgi:HSP20 family protein
MAPQFAPAQRGRSGTRAIVGRSAVGCEAAHASGASRPRVVDAGREAGGGGAPPGWNARCRDRRGTKPLHEEATAMTREASRASSEQDTKTGRGETGERAPARGGGEESRRSAARRTSQQGDDMLGRFVDALERMFAPFGGGRETFAPFGGGREGEDRWAPRVDVRRENGTLMVRADLPGVERDDVRVEVEGDRLVIAGERYDCSEAEGEPYRQECRYGSFLRVLPLPEGAEVEQGSATFENGVLEVRIPTRDDQSRRRRIEVGARAAESIAHAGRSAKEAAEEEGGGRQGGSREAQGGGSQQSAAR